MWIWNPDLCFSHRYIQGVPGGKVNILGSHSIGHSKQKGVLYWTVSELLLFHCTVPKLLLKKRYQVLFLIPVFLFKWQSWYNLHLHIIHFWKFQHQHQWTLELIWEHGVLLVCAVYCVPYSEIALSRKLFRSGHRYLYRVLPRITHFVTSKNIDLSSWVTLYFDNFYDMSFSLPCFSVI
jgi:hypothetical protein